MNELSLAIKKHYVASTVKERDSVLEELYKALCEVPVNSETNCIEMDFIDWSAGTSIWTIHEWFSERYSKGIVGLMYPNAPTTQEEEDIEEIRYAIGELDDDDINELYYRLTRDEMERLIPRMAKRMRRYIDHDDSWVEDRDAAIRDVAWEYANEEMNANGDL